MVGDKFPNIDTIQKTTCPVMICHGRDDEVVPFEHGMALYEACPNKTEPCWMEDVGHNDHGVTWAKSLRLAYKIPIIHDSDRRPKILFVDFQGFQI